MSQSTLPAYDQASARGSAAKAPEQAGRWSAPRSWASSWRNWALLVIFMFIALESILLALVLQGRWLILFAPGLVCAGKAWETWREMRGAEGRRWNNAAK